MALAGGPGGLTLTPCSPSMTGALSGVRRRSSARPVLRGGDAPIADGLDGEAPVVDPRERAGAPVAVAGLAIGAAGDFLGEMRSGPRRCRRCAKWANLKSPTMNAGGPGGRVRDHALAKPGHLVAEFPAIGGMEVAGEVPPFRFESGVRAVVAGELVMPAGERDPPAVGRGAVGERRAGAAGPWMERFSFFAKCAGDLDAAGLPLPGPRAASMAAAMIQRGVVAIMGQGHWSSMVQPKKALLTTQVRTMARHMPEAMPRALATSAEQGGLAEQHSPHLPARCADCAQDADLALALDDQRGEGEEYADDCHQHRDHSHDARDGEGLVEDGEDAAAERAVGIDDEARARPSAPARGRRRRRASAPGLQVNGERS